MAQRRYSEDQDPFGRDGGFPGGGQGSENLPNLPAVPETPLPEGVIDLTSGIPGMGGPSVPPPPNQPTLGEGQTLSNGAVLGEPIMGNTQKGREREGGGASAPTSKLREPGSRPAPDEGGGGGSGQMSTAPARPRVPTPAAALPPQPFTPMPDPMGDQGLAQAQMREPTLYNSGIGGSLMGGAGGLLGGGLGAAGVNPDETDLTSLILALLEGR